MTAANDLDASGFPAFFEGLRGHEPFPWQQRLVARLLEDLVEAAVPEVLAVPTGMGKTAVIDAWAYALAARVRAGAATLPRRLCVVVDRRLVVDDAAVHAGELAEALRAAREQPVMHGDGREQVAEALADLSGHAAAPLRVARMRGGITWESRWLPRPDQPAVVVGTVDQFGSRLLFRGYTQNQRMWSIDAALTGLDAWLVVDEAHLAEPLRRTVDEVAALQQRSPLERHRRLRLTRMSATPGEAWSPLAATADSETDAPELPRAAAEAATRLGVVKPTALLDLVHLSDPSGRQWRRRAARLGEALAAAARALAEPGTVVGVVANTVATARAAFGALRAHEETAGLLIGRCREHERDAVLAAWEPVARVGASREAARRFVVATQTVEVGVNFDLDALVSECAPLASLIQRFGRVNRVGTRPVRTSAVVRAGFAHDDDPVYGAATGVTWRLLAAEAGEHAEVGRREVGRRWPETTVDLGPASADRLRRQAPPETEVATPVVPVLLGVHLERWTQTSPRPEPDQPVAPFLHGAERGTPDVTVAWRATPPATEGDLSDVARWRAWLELAPPVSWEFVDVPVWEVRGLLANRAPEAPTADVEGAPVPVEDESAGAVTATAAPAVGVVDRAGSGHWEAVRSPGDVAPGDRVVLASELGGHDAWGWTGAEPEAPAIPVPDVGDLAPSRRRGLRRLCWEVLASWGVADGGGLRASLSELDVAERDVGSMVDEVVDQLRAGRASAERDVTPLADAYESARSWPAAPTEFLGPDGKGTAVVLLDRSSRAARAGAIRDHDEVSTSLTSEAAVTLDAHGESVGRRARELAAHLELPDELVRAAELAACWHDLGKADPRFQVMLHDGDRLAAAAAPRPLAKSGRDPRDPVARAASRVAGVPRGFRHEARSARLAAQRLTSAASDHGDVDADLVVHLIASHHGWARPLLPEITDVEAPVLELEVEGVHVADPNGRHQPDWAHPSRLQRLHERYGWWGVALLETVVRLADIGCSEEGR